MSTFNDILTEVSTRRGTLGPPWYSTWVEAAEDIFSRMEGIKTLLRLSFKEQSAQVCIRDLASVAVNALCLYRNVPFEAVLEEIKQTHEKKSLDYGSDQDPLANVRASSDFGVPGWIGALIRGNDKIVRMKSFMAKGKLVNESVEDSILDLAVYAIISLQLIGEVIQEQERKTDDASQVSA